MEINEFQRRTMTLKLHDLLGDVQGKRVGMLGLAFKENTDDIRESPALSIARQLMEQGAEVRGYDPVAMDNVAREMPGLILCGNAYELAQDVDALVVATPWNEFKQLDMRRIKESMRQPNMVDGRNMYDAALMWSYGFNYRGVGRGFGGKGINDASDE
jgi:UDPglucose 6-dehydrogenase